MLEPPSFLRLAGHPLRWRLLSALAGNDLRVGELCALSGERQNLVSYHLRRLREGGLVDARRSSADGRDSYYVLDLTRCRELLEHVGASLHPALAPSFGGPVPSASVLFLCTGNSARSQMAEALCGLLSGGAISAVSAGSRPKPLHDEAVLTMRLRGLDIAGARSKHLSEFTDRRLDYVISLCDRVREVCPEFPGDVERLHWSVVEPTEPEEFEACAAELETRIGFFIKAIQAGGVSRA